MVLDVDAGAVWDTARVRQRLRGLGVRRRIVHSEVSATGLGSLTPAETAVAWLAIEGRTNREIAQQLFISPHTAKSHVKNTMLKLGAHDRAQLVIAAYESGLLRPGH